MLCYNFFMSIEAIKDTTETIKKGHVHRRLTFRLVFLSGISILFFISGIAKFIKFDLKAYVIFILVIGGFLCGFFLFSKMKRIAWDKDKRIIYTTKLDIVDIILLLIYALFEALIKIFLKDVYPNVNVASAYSTITIASLISGRIISMLKTVQKISRDEKILK